MFIRISASLPLAIIAVMSSACAANQNAYNRQVAELTTPSMIGIAAADSTATALGVKTNKSPAEQEFLLKMAKINADRDVGVASAQAKAAALAWLMQRYGSGYGGGYGSNATGYVTPYNQGRPVQCAYPGC